MALKCGLCFQFRLESDLSDFQGVSACTNCVLIVDQVNDYVQETFDSNFTNFQAFPPVKDLKPDEVDPSLPPSTFHHCNPTYRKALVSQHEVIPFQPLGVDTPGPTTSFIHNIATTPDVTFTPATPVASAVPSSSNFQDFPPLGTSTLTEGKNR